MDPQSAIKISVILYWSALLIYTSYWIVGFMGRGIRFYVLLGGVVLHTASITFRGIAIEYFPLTNKFESFTGFALACFSVLLFYSRVESYVYRISTFLRGILFLCCGFCLLFSYLMKVSYAPPLMLTIWYILHVPISFYCYALWTSAFGAAMARYFSGGEDKRRFENIIDAGFQYGFIAFSISMIFGGLWGYVAWGSYFLWDAKLCCGL